MRIPVLLLALAGCCGIAAADEPPLFAERSAPEPGSPAVIVPPDYPKEAAARKQAGSVEVEAVVDHRNGRLTQVKLRPTTEADAIFVPAVEEVVSLWRFHPELVACRPVDSPILTRVHFEWTDGKPRISMDRTAPAALPEAFKPLRRFEPRYPTDMLRRGYQSDVYALMRIEPNGEPSSVDAAAYPAEKANQLWSFADVVKRTLMEWRYPPRPEGPWRNCITISFRLRN